MKVKPFYTVREVAEMLGVSERTVRTYVETGQLESAKVGGRRLIPLSALTSYASIWESIRLAGAHEK